MGQFALGIRSLVIKSAIFVVLAALLAWTLGGTLFPRAETADAPPAVTWHGATWRLRAAIGGDHRGRVRWNLMRQADDEKPTPWPLAGFDDWSDAAGPVATSASLYVAFRDRDAADWTMAAITDTGFETSSYPDRLEIERQFARLRNGLVAQSAIEAAATRDGVLRAERAMQNVEFKAEIRDLEAARSQCAIVRAKPQGSFVQIDTYFRIPDGRLKRRETPGQAAEWIWYQRPDSVAARVSRYTLLNDEQARVRFGAGTLIPWKIVRKTRELWLLENVRIHLDHVEDVGNFIEFEAVVTPQHDLAECRKMLAQLREAFEPILGEAIAGSYEALVSELADSERQARLP